MKQQRRKDTVLLYFREGLCSCKLKLLTSSQKPIYRVQESVSGKKNDNPGTQTNIYANWCEVFIQLALQSKEWSEVYSAFTPL
jgi:hypothetical protein